jgi:hypothetical protein
MECIDCPLKYVGQMDQMLYTIYKEHIQSIRNNNGKSGYLNHILNTGHAYLCISDTIKVVRIEKESTMCIKWGKIDYTLMMHILTCIN